MILSVVVDKDWWLWFDAGTSQSGGPLCDAGTQESTFCMVGIQEQ